MLAEVPNRLTLEGHTDAAPFGGGERGYSNWELSADRANASRRELMAGGLPEDRMLRVQGLASSTPFDAKDAAGTGNRRISIIVMNREAEDRFFRTELRAPAVVEPVAQRGRVDRAEPAYAELRRKALPPAATKKKRGLARE